MLVMRLTIKLTFSLRDKFSIKKALTCCIAIFGLEPTYVLETLYESQNEIYSYGFHHTV